MQRAMILALTATLALPAAAQPTSTERLATVIASVPSRETVRLATGGQRLTGKVTERQPESLTLIVTPSLEPRRLRMESVDSLWRYSGSNGRKASATGAKVGALVGAVFLARVAYGFGAKPEYFLMSIPVGAAGGAAVGGTVGGAIGLTQNRWQLHYVR